MDIITTSLEALIQRATNVNNQGPDTAAIDAFCGLINKEPDCAQTAAKLITSKVHSLHEWEALQALLVLETCMKRCGSLFHAEVGKFRFLNELIKLVSPKYLGTHTPEPVRRRVLELMHIWTIRYPKETKIKEAYDMLKKQGVVKEEIPPPVVSKEVTPRHHSSILQDEEKSQLLQKLLQSKNPEDLQAANRLIKSMVKEDERRLEEKWRHAVELETVVNNCRLLKEMLDNYNPDSSSSQDLELIRELHSTCQNLRPVIFKLASNNADPAFCTDVLTANDELGEVFSKYNAIIQGGPKSGSNPHNSSSSQNAPSLLDLTPSPTQNVDSAANQLSQLDLDLSMNPSPANYQSSPKPPGPDYLTTLDEIFNTPSNVLQNSARPHLMPSVTLTNKNESPQKQNTGKSKGFEELDILGESLLKESLTSSAKSVAQPTKANTKLPMNQLNRTTAPLLTSQDNMSSVVENLLQVGPLSKGDLLLDDPLLTELETPSTEVPEEIKHTPSELPKVKLKDDKDAVLPLADLHVTLESIKPSCVPPFRAFEDRNDINVIIYLAKDCPRPDVAVFVVTTSSKSQSPVSNFLFQPVVPKCCRLRMMPPTSTTLPAHNPFLPPSVISQVMLIGSPTKEAITLKFVISYEMGDTEIVTEMGEINDLLLKETAV